MKKIFYLFTALTLVQCTLNIDQASAQSFQWATAAGSNNIDNKADIPVDMAADVNGNSYLLSKIHSTGIYVGSSSIPDGAGLSSSVMTMLSSLDKNGKYRWSKVIGAAGTIPKEVKVVKDKVYMFGVVGTTTGYNAYYDKDYTTPSDYYSGMSLACYDTSGNFKWVVRPDSIVGIDPKYYRLISFDVDESGNSYMLVSMPNGSKIIGSSLLIPLTATYKGGGFYVLKYGVTGTLISVIMLKDFCYTSGNQGGVDNFRFTLNKLTNQYYVYGVSVQDPFFDTLYINSSKMTNSLFFATFENDGTYKWDIQDDRKTLGTLGIRGARVDASGNIIIGGSAVEGVTFNGFKFTNALSSIPGTGLPFIMKMSSTGSLIWCKSGGSFSGVTTFSTIFPFATNNKFAGIGGLSGNKVYFGETKDSVFVNTSGQDGWFAVVDINTGKTVKMGAARGDGFYDAIRAMSFSGDDLYIAGNFEGSKMIFDSSAVSVGPAKSRTDLFVAKMSTNKLSVEQASGNLVNIKIYPNPANDLLYIEQLREGTEVRLFSMSGQQVYNGIASGNLHQLSVSAFAPGTYILQLRDQSGEVYSAKIMKQ